MRYAFRVGMAISRLALCAVMLLAACGGREGGAGSAGPASGASNGSGGSTVASGASTGTSAPACQITSAQSTLVWDVACYPQSALPTGACSGGSASCSFCSFVECADVPDQSHSPRTFYSCACDGGQWSCAVVNQDVGVCPLSANGASDDAGSDASDAAAGCLAAGGECAPCTDPQFDLANLEGTSCMLSRPCTAIGFQNCGLGAACCLNVCDPNARVIRASNYDQTCAVDTDCTAISEGSTCNACNFACPNAAINVNALPQYSSATASLNPAAGDLCASSCGPAMRTCCRGGTCQWGSPTPCPFPGAQPVDSGVDSRDAGPE
jgi:hypothetical protein